MKTTLVALVSALFCWILPLPGFATPVEIVGNVSYQTVNNGSAVRIRVESLINRSQTELSGTIHLRLWATSGPNPVGNGYLLADSNLGAFLPDTGRLPPGGGYSNVETTVPFTRPADGEYYIHLYVSEFPALSTILDSLTFPGTEIFGNPPPAPPPPPPPSTDDHSNTFENATPISASGTAQGVLNPSGDTDFFSFTVSEAGVLRVATEGSTDTVGRLYDASRTQLAENDDGGGAGLNFRIERQIAAGTHYVSVRGFQDVSTGEYQLALLFTPSNSPPPPEPAPPTPTPPTPAPPQPAPVSQPSGGGGGGSSSALLSCLLLALWRARLRFVRR